ncbi:hypothetical protein [Sphingomonas hankyongi]|uniref:Histone H1 n=1 Tax=Sphingomonas hankyongi TaxID=2908209 RepID=A0ABT0RZ06_9SPHN|nr:hypothetical protein [Sphingomonas hankyongi]MCL6728696.1 hypothetical protein [Sphingomonas hankyongi]
MAKKATKAGGGAKAKKADSKPKSRAVARVSSSRGGSKGDNGFNAGDAFIKLLQSPLVAELVAVAATAALASLAEHGFTSGDATRGKRAGRAVKAAGKAAAAAVGRRLSTEMDEIKQAAKAAKRGAGG